VFHHINLRRLAVAAACVASLACATASTGGRETASANQAGDILQPTVADLAYATNSPSEKLDLYLPQPGDAPSPLVIWIHGGGFRLGDKRSIRRRIVGPPPRPVDRDGPYQIQVPDVVALNSKGYAVAAINYRLGSSMGSAALAAIQDGKAAVRFLRANAGTYHIDPGKIAVWGDSAGGYMAAMLGATGDQRTVFDAPGLGDAATSSAVQAVVVWFGAEDRLPGALSIASHLHGAGTLPAFMIANGDADPVISSEQARRLHTALLGAGASATLTILPGAGHEDPAFMATQMLPSFEFLDRTFGR
jgi:acetyl esterase/lipase